MIIERTANLFDLKICAEIWLDASIAAHTFMEPGFWASHQPVIAEEYLPASEVYIAKKHSKIKGFAAIRNDSLAALFIDPAEWGKGIGSRLLCHVKDLYNNLELSVYKSNIRAVEFYKRHGFSLKNGQVCSHTGEEELLMYIHVPLQI